MSTKKNKINIKILQIRGDSQLCKAPRSDATY